MRISSTTRESVLHESVNDPYMCPICLWVRLCGTSLTNTSRNKRTSTYATSCHPRNQPSLLIQGSSKCAGKSTKSGEALSSPHSVASPSPFRHARPGLCHCLYRDGVGHLGSGSYSILEAKGEVVRVVGSSLGSITPFPQQSVRAYFSS